MLVLFQLTWCYCVKELTAIQAKIFELGTTLEQLSTTSRTAVGGSCLSVTEVKFNLLTA